FSYTADGAVASRTDAAGTTSYGYDGAGRVFRAGHPPPRGSPSPGHNGPSPPRLGAHRPRGGVGGGGHGGVDRPAHDQRETAGGASVAKITYGYDANSNLTSKTTTGFAGAAANTYTYDLANRLTSWNDGSTTTGYGYDAAGNRVQAGSRTFTYDQRNR